MARTRCTPAAGEVLNVAGWLFPGEGYQWFRQRLGRWPYRPFLFYATCYGIGFPYFNYEMPPADDSSARLKRRMEGVLVLPIGEAFDAHLQRHPQMAQGGFQRLPGRYLCDAVTYAQSWKRIVLRGGFEPADQYLALDGMQGLEWSYDDINAIVRYDDLGQTLLKSQWDARTVESRLEMNTLLASNGTPGAKQSVMAQLATTADLGRGIAAGKPGSRPRRGRLDAESALAEECLVPGGRRGSPGAATATISWPKPGFHGTRSLCMEQRRGPRRAT